jgi:hypothetical protein
VKLKERLKDPWIYAPFVVAAILVGWTVLDVVRKGWHD